METPWSWIRADETAKVALLRAFSERPVVVLPPPLHHIPFRAGNVVELVGSSPSAKTHILNQAAINCILPKDWKGVQYGGLERAVMFVDLDCRFDVLSLSKALELRILAVKGSCCDMKRHELDRELFMTCMRRFLYIRCYNSLEFLATLKTMHYRLQKEKETQAGGVYMLMLDSIGAFYWMDRALPSSSSTSSRKNLSLQSMTETVVQEIQRLMLVHPILVLATKSALSSDKQSKTEVSRDLGKWPAEHATKLSGPQSLSHREYMPSAWKCLVTHRVLLRATEDNGDPKSRPTFSTEWLLPALALSDKFMINNDGSLVML
ncbi:DNA repair protein XRCC2 homolog isoform X2 [Henckelia pumila]|uniref:DNA repair protein XRCC2 homolog isoform X2 n=1 Tax=Henckelia pumila TaxID=405737 RepID=UPI003C6E0C6E